MGCGEQQGGAGEGLEVDMQRGWAKQTFLPLPQCSLLTVLSDSRRRLVSQGPLTFSAALDDEEDKGHKEECQKNPSKKGQDYVFLSVLAETKGSR